MYYIDPVLAAMGSEEAAGGVVDESKAESASDALAEPNAIRDDFPETWIFTEVVTRLLAMCIYTFCKHPFLFFSLYDNKFCVCT